MRNKKVKQMRQSVSGCEWVFDSEGRGASLWALKICDFSGDIAIDLEKSQRVNSTISLTADQLRGKK